MQMVTKSTPVDELAEAVKWKASTDSGTGMGRVPNVDDLLFQALWRKCENYNATQYFIQGKGLTWEALLENGKFCAEGKDACGGSGAIRRSREDAWYLLPEVGFVKAHLIADDWNLICYNENTWAIQNSYNRLILGKGPHPLDALCAAILTELKAKEGVKHG